MDVGFIAERRLEPWKIWVSFGVCAFLALGVATNTLKPYHWFLLLLVPGAALAAERGRQLFLDWAPLFLSWVTYDRMRWVQPLLYSRVAVDGPYELERVLFGWVAGGDVPAHAARAWLAGVAGTGPGHALSIALQAIYLSHLAIYPALFLVWWLRGRTRERDRERFRRHVRAFATLNVIGFVGYLALPTAPPWWVSAYGFQPPTAALVAALPLATALDGAIVQKTIATAPNWFAAFPSLHGAYPVLLAALNRRAGDRAVLVAALVYGAAMWTATVVLNLHYVLDLVAGAFLALAVAGLADWHAPAAEVSPRGREDGAPGR